MQKFIKALKNEMQTKCFLIGMIALFISILLFIDFLMITYIGSGLTHYETPLLITCKFLGIFTTNSLFLLMVGLLKFLII